MNIVEQFDSTKFYLGFPCKYGHEKETGKNLRYRKGRRCVACDTTHDKNKVCPREQNVIVLERFWLKVEKTDACWNWIGAKNRKGYGEIRVNSKKFMAHRFIWMQEHGEIPSGMFVCHRCDNPQCVRLDHLFLGTPQENTDDMLLKGRNRCVPKKGSEVYNARLTESQVTEIRLKYASGKYTQMQLAQEYNIPHQGTIANIVNYKIWKHV